MATIGEILAAKKSTVRECVELRAHAKVCDGQCVGHTDCERKAQRALDTLDSREREAVELAEVAP